MNTLFYITNQTIERSTRVIEPVNGNLSPATILIQIKLMD